MSERPSVAASFKSVKSRGESLSGILKPTGPRLLEEITDAEFAPVDQTGTAVTNVAAYLPQPLLSGLKQYKAQHGGQYSDVLLDAFDAVSDEQLRASFLPNPSGGRAPRRGVSTKRVGGFQVQFRLTPEQVKWTQQIQQRTGAPSRSALFATILAIYLEALTEK